MILSKYNPHQYCLQCYNYNTVQQQKNIAKGRDTILLLCYCILLLSIHSWLPGPPHIRAAALLILGSEGCEQPALDTVQPVRETVFSSEICSVEVSTSQPEQGGTILFDDIGKIIFLLASSQTKISLLSCTGGFLYYFASKIRPFLVLHVPTNPKPFDILNFRRIENFSIKLQLWIG